MALDGNVVVLADGIEAVASGADAGSASAGIGVAEPRIPCRLDAGAGRPGDLPEEDVLNGGDAGGGGGRKG